MKNNKLHKCDNCKFEFSPDIEFCPQCGIPARVIKKDNEASFICSVCDTKNPIGERKCAYCCSLL